MKSTSSAAFDTASPGVRRAGPFSPGSRIVALALATALIAPIAAQQQRTPSSAPAASLQTAPSTAGSPIAAMKDAIVVPVVVTTRSGEHVRGLDRSAFGVQEKSERLVVTGFAAGEGPVSIAFVVDASKSVSAEDLTRTQAAVTTMLDALSAGGEYTVIGFGSGVKSTGWNADRAVVHQALDRLRDDHRAGRLGRSSLHDAMLHGFEAVRTARFARRAVIVVSDGQDTSSARPAGDVERAIRRTPAVMYAFVLRASGTAAGYSPVMDLAKLTGGRIFKPSSARDWATAADAVASDLRHQYLLGLVPPAKGADGRWHDVKVTVTDPAQGALTIRSRTGYETDRP